MNDFVAFTAQLLEAKQWESLSAPYTNGASQPLVSRLLSKLPAHEERDHGKGKGVANGHPPTLPNPPVLQVEHARSGPARP